MTGLAELDEVSHVGLVADLIPDESQPRLGFLDQLALCWRLTCQHAVVGIWVMAHQRASTIVTHHTASLITMKA
jgi:hypothetical protein